MVDNVAFWAAGKLTLVGQAVAAYDPGQLGAVVFRELGRHWPVPIPHTYPPPSLLLVWPLGLLDYPEAWAASACVGVTLWAGVLWLIRRDAISAMFAAFAFGGGTHSILLGQSGFLTASLLAGALLALRRSKLIAGLLLGLLGLKPHIAVCAFVALSVWREWRVLACAAATMSALFIGSLIAFGSRIWFAFEAGEAAFTAHLFAQNTHLIAAKMQSVFATWLHELGWRAALSLHLLTASIGLALLVKTTGQNQRAAAVISGTTLVSPYIFLYDLTMLSAAAMFLLIDARTGGERALIIASAALPSVWLIAGVHAGPIAGLSLLGLGFLQCVRGTDEIAIAHLRP